MDTEGRILIGVIWLVFGLYCLRRATIDEANPRAPITLFSEPEVQTDKDRTSKVYLGVAGLMMGAVYVLTGLFSRR